MSWDEAWDITTQSVAYTNHTVLAEALERWPQSLVEHCCPASGRSCWRLPAAGRKRWRASTTTRAKTEKMAIIWGGEVRMANLCIAGGMAVNGVSALHSDILKKDVFKDAYGMEPWKFTNVTNGIDHRRWLSEINPGLDSLIRDLTGGEDYLLQPLVLRKLDDYADDAAVLKAPGGHQAAQQGGLRRLCQAGTGGESEPGRYLRRSGQAAPRVQAAATQRAAYHCALPATSGRSRLPLPSPTHSFSAPRRRRATRWPSGSSA